jgi:hypothetical protein
VVGCTGLAPDSAPQHAMCETPRLNTWLACRPRAPFGARVLPTAVCLSNVQEHCAVRAQMACSLSPALSGAAGLHLRGDCQRFAGRQGWTMPMLFRPRALTSSRLSSAAGVGSGHAWTASHSTELPVRWIFFGDLRRHLNGRVRWRQSQVRERRQTVSLVQRAFRVFRNVAHDQRWAAES